ncbi:hypothetical protein PSHT_09075 [Puccinia striiformis]|uniref:BZIP domain-containing protein n=1 Tax=Puccinia striiformis TaxID=27350 RepID=A0A2S4VJS9_9BASI|nr:hypothetical protein PSHT_09075 [Puccinia striiformis]
MPRQPLADTPGLPPYGQRSSERRKEQNRIAQRQLRERRQQQEAAQALKLQQQQNEIRRLYRLITELRHENFTLRSQSHTRRRQSRLGFVTPPCNDIWTVSTLEPNYKPFLARHSIDYSSLHGAGIDPADTSHRLYEHKISKGWNCEDPRGLGFASQSRQPGARSTVLHPAQLAYDHQASRGAPRAPTCISHDTETPTDLDSEKPCLVNNFGAKVPSPRMSAAPATSKPPTSTWLSRNSTPPMGDVAAGVSPTSTWVNSPQKLEQSPRLNSVPKTGSLYFTPPSVNLASFWPAEPPTSPNKLGSYGDIDHVYPPTLSVVPSEFFSASHPLMSGDRIQLRKTSASGSSDANSIAPSSDNHSSLSTSSTTSFQFPFISPELFQHHVARSASPTAIRSSPEAQLEQRNLGDANATICFRSPFSEINDSEINAHSNFGLPMSWIEPKKMNREALSPLPTHARSMCIDVNEMWGSDF